MSQNKLKRYVEYFVPSGSGGLRNALLAKRRRECGDYGIMGMEREQTG
jgi:hypothetical protein